MPALCLLPMIEGHRKTCGKGGVECYARTVEHWCVPRAPRQYDPPTFQWLQATHCHKSVSENKGKCERSTRGPRCLASISAMRPGEGARLCTPSSSNDPDHAPSVTEPSISESKGARIELGTGEPRGGTESGEDVASGRTCDPGYWLSNTCAALC